MKFAPLAAGHASKLGAQREAAVHLDRRCGSPSSFRSSSGRSFSAQAFDLFVTVQFREAIAAQEQALRCYQALGIRPAQGAALAFLAQLHWQAGSLAEGLAIAQRALDVLEGLPGPELVAAYKMMAVLLLAAEDPALAMTWAKRAQDLAEQLMSPKVAFRPCRWSAGWS